MKKKICIVTAARSEYGVLHWVIDEVNNDNDFQLQLVVTGAHLSSGQGLTYKFIEQDGYTITAKVDMHLTSDDKANLVRSMGKCSEGFADVFEDLKPDLVVVLGDRYELLPIVSAALVMRIPVAHISGGDVTEGAIDDEVRNAVSMMSTLHFPGVIDSAKNLHRMLGSEKNVYAVGEPGLDSFLRYKLWDKETTAKELNLDLQKKWCLVTLHPETKISLEENVNMVQSLYASMQQIHDIQYVITKANTDAGGAAINDFWTEVVKNNSNFQLYASLGQIRYLSFMKHADMVIGNSSSGIIEAPFMGTPVVNIGDRQKGRHICKNVICCERNQEEILNAIIKADKTERIIDTYWGDGHSSERIVAEIMKYLLS